MLLITYHMRSKACMIIFMSDFIHGGDPVRCIYAANREAGVGTAKSKHNPCINFEQKVQSKRQARAVYCCKSGSKTFQRQSHQNREKLIEYGMSGGLSRGQVNAGMHGSVRVPNRASLVASL